MTDVEASGSTAHTPLVSDDLRWKIQRVLQSRDVNRRVIQEATVSGAAQAERSCLKPLNQDQAVPITTSLSEQSKSQYAQDDEERRYPASVNGCAQDRRRRDGGDAALVLLFALSEQGPTARTWQRWRRWRQRIRLDEPVWRTERPYGDGSFRVLLADPEGILHPRGQLPMSSSPASVEAQLLRDLQFALLGYPANTRAVAVTALANSATSFGARYLLRPVVYGLTLPTGLRALAQHILDTAGALSTLRGFAESCSFYSQGMVRQAMGAAIRDILRRYDWFFTRKWCWARADSPNLETASDATADAPLTIQRLWLSLQPIEGVIRALANACLGERVGKQRGGALLCALYDLADQGQGRWNLNEPGPLSLDDPEAMWREVFWGALQPFWEMMEHWIDEGTLVDPHDEFCVQQDTAQRGERLADDFNAAFWERAYTLRVSHLPRVFAPLATSILLAGKYRLAADSMARTAHALEAEDVSNAAQIEVEAANTADGGASNHRARFSLQHMTARITSAYTTALRSFLEAMLHDDDLIHVLDQFKRWFLLSRADLLDDLISATPIDLLTERCMSLGVIEDAQAIEYKQTQLNDAMRDACIRQSTAYTSRAGRFFITLLPYSLSSQLLRVLAVSGTAAPWSSAEAAELATLTHPSCTRDAHLCVMDSMALDYHAHWPYSLVLNRRTITKFQLLFRHLLSLHLCLHRLNMIWIQLQHGLCPNNVDAENGALTKEAALPVYCAQLRQTIQALLHSMTWGTIEPQWIRWQQTLDCLRASLRTFAPQQRQLISKSTDDVSIDALMSALHEFLDACLHGCFLTVVRSFRSVRQIISLAHRLVTSFHHLPSNLHSERITSDMHTLNAAVASLVQSLDRAHPLWAWYEGSQVRALPV